MTRRPDGPSVPLLRRGGTGADASASAPLDHRLIFSRFAALLARRLTRPGVPRLREV